MAPTHRTPLRRVSRGSLAAISRSGNFPDAPAGLGFIGPALENLADETEALHANVESLHNLAHSLEKFNESFASYLYVQKVNTFCVEWFQAPIEGSYELAEKRAEEAARAATAVVASRRVAAPTVAPHGGEAATAVSDKTMMGDLTFAISEAQSPLGVRKPKLKKKMKPKMTVKEKRERSVMLEKVCSVLPLEFRGSDPTLRRQVEHVIESLMDAEGSLKITDMIQGDINQAKVNKCLIALVNRKVVQKTQAQSGVFYTWQGL